MFKKRRGIRLSYNKQGLIYFTCMNIKDMPENIQQKVLNLCVEVGQQDYRALYELLTNDNKSVLSISHEYFLNEKRLYKMRKEFYEKWSNTKGTP